MFRLALEDAVATLTLDRPELRNAIPAAEWAALAATLRETEGARLLVLRGAGGAFCAGADLADFPAMRGDPPARSRFRREMRRALDLLAALPVPTLAVVDGPCFGAGVALAMACDLRIAGRDAAFAVTPAKLGISYPQEDVHRLVSLVGPGQAARLLLGAVRIDGAEAARIGLVEQHAPEGLEDAVEALCSALLANSPESLETLKTGIALAAAGAAEDETQDRRFDALLGSDAVAARLESLRGRRLPRG